MAECGLQRRLALAAFAAAFVFVAGVTAFAGGMKQENTHDHTSLCRPLGDTG